MPSTRRLADVGRKGRNARHVRRCATLLVLGSAFIWSTTMLGACSDEEPERAIPFGGDGAPLADASLRDAPVQDGPDAATLDAARGPVEPLHRLACSDPNECAEAIVAPLSGPLDCDAPSNCAATIRPALSETFCVKRTTGTIVCWGEGGSGQLGRDLGGGHVGVPERVPGVEDIDVLDRSCAVTKSGVILCWGVGYSKLLGPDGGDSPVATRLALPSARRVRMSNEIGCAELTTGALTCWGTDLAIASGQIGDAGGADTADLRPSGVRLADFAVSSRKRGSSSGGATFIKDEDGAVVSWGSGISLGRESSLDPDSVPAPIGVSPVSRLVTAGSRACAIAEGDVYCWGSDDATPEWIGLRDAVRIAVAPPSAFPRGCAVVRNGDVKCWGQNDSGQAGDGTTEVPPTPVRVAGLPEPAVEIEVTGRASCAILVSGKVYCWGDNSRGQLGRVTEFDESMVPVEVQFP